MLEINHLIWLLSTLSYDNGKPHNTIENDQTTTRIGNPIKRTIKASVYRM